MGYIYGIRKLNSQKYVYIGQTKNGVEERFRKHIQQARENKHDNKSLEEFLNNNHCVIDVLCVCSEADLSKYEMFFIKFFSKYYQLLNIQGV